MSANVLSSSKLSTSTSEIVLKENGLIYVTILEDSYSDVFEIVQIRNSLKKLSDGKPAFILVFPGKGSTTTKEAREFASNNRKEANIAAEAIVVTNLPTRILANFFIKLAKAKDNIRIFSNEKEAVRWLLKEKNKMGKQ